MAQAARQTSRTERRYVGYSSPIFLMPSIPLHTGAALRGQQGGSAEAAEQADGEEEGNAMEE